MCSPFINFKSIPIQTVELIRKSEIWNRWRYIHSDNSHFFFFCSYVIIQLDFCYINICYYNKIIDIIYKIRYMNEFIVSFINLVTRQRMENMKTYCFLLHSFFFAHPFNDHQKKRLPSHNLNLIWFFFTSFGRKECNLTIKKLKHVQKA